MFRERTESGVPSRSAFAERVYTGFNFLQRMAAWRLCAWAAIAWSNRSLSVRFAVSATAVVAVCMVLLGILVNERIKQGVIANTAANAALYLVGFVEPHLQELTNRRDLSKAGEKKLDELLASTVLRSANIVDIKVWRPDGLLVYSKDKSRIGKSYPVGEALRKASLGQVASEFNDLDEEENSAERLLGVPMMEVYTPIRNLQNNQVIAVIEIYEVATSLDRELRRTRNETALAIVAFSLMLLGSLMQVVGQGSKTIDAQQNALSLRIEELSRMLSINRSLRASLADANTRAAEGNERFLRNIGADLHDGPVQLISLGLLRLEMLKPDNTSVSRADAERVFGTVNKALADALCEIRSICSGMIIPELRDSTPKSAITLAVANHMRRTGTCVDLKVGLLPEHVQQALATTLYRFVQEGLTNAWRHAGAAEQRVEAGIDRGVLVVKVADSGGGLPAGDQALSRRGRGLSLGLGLEGLRDRIESMGGTMRIRSGGQGTVLIARFRLENLG